jgi:pSer/pThr/pTyr-binding forkhead associated (FHA) protein
VATLRVYRGDQFVAPFELGEGRTRIGRGTENQLVLEDRDKQVSRTHAEIWFERGRYLIADLNSQNGVWIGERQIKSEEPLPVSVPVTIGPYRLILVPDESAGQAAGVDAVPGTSAEPYVEPTQLGELPSLPPPAATTPPRHVPGAPAATPPALAGSGRTQSGKPKTPAPAAGNKRTLVIAAAVAAVLIAAVAVMYLTKSPAPETTVAENPPPTSSSSSTSTVPAVPTPEEVFQEHFTRAQTLIAEGNKSGARDANTAALAALPNDPRGLEQLKAIEALVDPNAPATAATPTGAAPGTPKPAVVSTVPETLRVTARAGEPERERANREKTARAQLDEGRKALAERRLDAAVTALQGALNSSGRLDFGQTPNEAGNLLARARNDQKAAIAAARNAAAQKAVADARGLASSDIAAAMQRLRDARGLDPDVEGTAELEKTLIDNARSQGETALSSAKNLDRGRRTAQAIAEYERAVQLLGLLPGEHKELALAKQRLADLKK